MADLPLRYLPLLFVSDAVLVAGHFAGAWDLDQERNLPTWFAGVQLILLGLAALACYERERQDRRRLFPAAGTWALATVFFFYLSLDETTVVHEGLLRDRVRDLFPPDSLWISLLPWQLVFGPLLAVMVVVLLSLFLTRFAGRRSLLVPALGGLACWVVAVLAEGLAKPLFMSRGWYGLEVALEEGLELLGATLLLLAFSRYAHALQHDPAPVVEWRAQQRRVAVAALLVVFVVALGAAVVAAVSLGNSAWLYRHNASLLQKRARYAEAIVAYRQALARDADDAASLRGTALCHYRLGDYAAAREWYERAAAVRPNDARLWHDQAATLNRLERFAEAESAYRRAVELSPRYAPAWAGLGRVLEKQRRADEAVAAYREALALDPHERLARRRMERAAGGD